MLRRLASFSIRRPRLVFATWALIAVLGVAAAGALFSSLDTDLPRPNSFQSVQVDNILDRLDPHGGSIAAVVEGGTVSDATIHRLEAIPGVATVQHGPSADGSIVGIGVELRPNLSDGAESRATSQVESTIRAVPAKRVLVGGELLVDKEFAQRSESDAQRAELISLPIALVVMAII